MQNKINYQKELDKLLEDQTKNHLRPTLLLHSCCAPCSSYVLEYLSKYFAITLYFYNPNIDSLEEYEKRAKELQRFVSEYPGIADIPVVVAPYDHEAFVEMAEGLERLEEGGARCFKCYELRLKSAADFASGEGFDYFTTTLSISPHKNAEKLNSLGQKLSGEFDVPYLYSDFKKKNGYKRSIELSAEYHLYRQNYCGCIYSKEAAERAGR